MQIFDTASLLSISDLHGNIIFANDKFCEISQYRMDELIGEPHSILRHPDMPSVAFKEMWQTITNGNTWQGELKNKAKDGSAYWVLSTIAPVIDKNGKPEKYISMLIDITKQKNAEESLAEAKKKIDNELIESINYAKQVHSNFISTEEDLQEIFSDSFVIYKAQKIISGDFFRVARYGKKSVIVCGDSTGHGLSASYISVILLNILNRLLKHFSKNPASALRQMNKEINEVTHPQNKKAIIESADTIACCIDHEKLELHYASAKMKGIIIRKGTIIPLEKDLCSIGETHDKDFQLMNHSIQLEKGDSIYLFSDGIVDQLGGKIYKRVGSKRFTNFLLGIQTKSMQKQKAEIEFQLQNWRGENEQTDDMTLLGWKID
jgi:PAS domain S-box-containing protein